MRAKLSAPLFFLVACFAPEQLPKTGSIETFTLASSKVGDTFQIFARVPAGDALPLIVQLDANLPIFEEFNVTAGIASQLEAQGVCPSTLVIGVGYEAPATSRVKRFRDLSLPIEQPAFKAAWARTAPDGRASEFYEFLRDELLPAIAERYSISDKRALFGHSMGGLFVTYAVTRHDEAPAFNAYVAASPSLFWDAGQMLRRWDAFAGTTTPAMFFTAAGQLEGPEMNTYFDEFTERLAKPGLTTSRQKFQADHLGNVVPSFRAGMSEWCSR